MRIAYVILLFIEYTKIILRYSLNYNNIKSSAALPVIYIRALTGIFKFRRVPPSLLVRSFLPNKFFLAKIGKILKIIKNYYLSILERIR